MQSLPDLQIFFHAKFDWICWSRVGNKPPSPVSCGCRIHRLPFWRELRSSPNECLRYDSRLQEERRVALVGLDFFYGISILYRLCLNLSHLKMLNENFQRSIVLFYGILNLVGYFTPNSVFNLLMKVIKIKTFNVGFTS